MKSDKTVFIISISILLIIAVLCAIGLGESYLKTIKENWNISLPTNCEKIYQAESKVDSHGDGYRYHVFQYEKDIPLKGLVPEQDFSEADTGRISWILSQLHVDKTYYPDFNTIIFSAVQKHSDNSQLYLCYSSENVLYVIEEFY